MNLVSLQFETGTCFHKNLDKLIYLINLSSQNSFILAPELCLSGYAYDRLDEAIDISNKAVPILKDLSKDKVVALTLTELKNHKYTNTLYIFHKGDIVHKQSKYKLFVLNDEKKYFTAGLLDDIKVIEINGLKVACLICFELRFIELWKRIQGADLILVPAMWGKLRKSNFEILTRALAVANQCFVLASNSANDEMGRGGAIITPFGETFKDDENDFLSEEINLNEIKKMRRYLPVGIK
jgi:predicted amidohydrolase